MRKWRADPVRNRKKQITSWRLVAGRGRERVWFNVGPMDKELAARCADAMNAEERETEGTPEYDRALRLAKEHPPERIAQMLLDEEAGLFEPPKPDYSRMLVSDYFDTMFWPERSDPDNSEFGIALSSSKAEAGYWRNKAEGRGILDGEIGRTRLRDLTDQHWVRWERSQDHLSGRSKVLRRSAYAALLQYARKNGHISYKPEFFPIRGATKRTRPEVAPLTLAELRDLMSVADSALQS